MTVPVGPDVEPAAAVVVAALAARGLTLGTAESLTGGLVCAALTSVPGASAVVRGGVIAYATDLKAALLGAIDVLRSYADPPGAERRSPADEGALVLAAADPANPYGAALPWPGSTDVDSGHRPGRKAGAVVVLVDGALALFVERGGRSVLTFDARADVLAAAAEALAAAARDGRLGAVTVERVDGASALGSAFAPTLEAAGFVATPRGLRLRVH